VRGWCLRLVSRPKLRIRLILLPLLLLLLLLLGEVRHLLLILLSLVGLAVSRLLLLAHLLIRSLQSHALLPDHRLEATHLALELLRLLLLQDTLVGGVDRHASAASPLESLRGQSLTLASLRTTATLLVTSTSIWAFLDLAILQITIFVVSRGVAHIRPVAFALSELLAQLLGFLLFLVIRELLLCRHHFFIEHIARIAPLARNKVVESGIYQLHCSLDHAR